MHRTGTKRPAKRRGTKRPTPRKASRAHSLIDDPQKQVVERLKSERDEALERQKATADILKVIASSPSDVQPVFEAIASSANRLLGGHSAAVMRAMDGVIHLAAFTPVNPAADAVLKSMFPMPVSAMPFFELLARGEPYQEPIWKLFRSSSQSSLLVRAAIGAHFGCP
jgi:hypothetical protein